MHWLLYRAVRRGYKFFEVGIHCLSSFTDAGLLGGLLEC
jgi:hypothetical protein